MVCVSVPLESMKMTIYFANCDKYTMDMKKIDWIIGIFCLNLLNFYVFLSFAQRYDILLVTGSLSLIPLVIILWRRLNG